MSNPSRNNQPAQGEARVVQTVRIVQHPNSLSRSRELAQLELRLMPKRETVFEQMRREDSETPTLP